MDLTSVSALVTSLKAATDLVGTLLRSKIDSDVRQKVGELQGSLLSAQQFALSATTAQFELRDRIRELESQLQATENWESDRQKYRLVSPWRGQAQAFALRKAGADGNAPHFLCANCFMNGRRSVLSPRKNDEKYIEMLCQTCKAAIATGFVSIGPAKFAEEYGEQQSAD